MSDAILARILKRVAVNEKTGCWEWVGRRNKWGYGTTHVGKDQFWLVHRLVYSLKVSPNIAGLCVCHYCDNPPCCNPEHLWIGTNADNVADRYRKGRSARGLRNGKYTCPEKIQRGQDVWKAILTDKSVREIRRIYSESKYSKHGEKKKIKIQLSERYSVSLETIEQVVYRKTWKHVN